LAEFEVAVTRRIRFGMITVYGGCGRGVRAVAIPQKSAFFSAFHNPIPNTYPPTLGNETIKRQ
jgi:hypothetical protein